jgi:hypothetical protein
MHDLDATLDALEEELGIGTNSKNEPYYMNNQFGKEHVTTATATATTNSDFISQAFPFSELVPSILKELQLAFIRLVALIVIPIPATLESIESLVSADKHVKSESSLRQQSSSMISITSLHGNLTFTEFLTQTVASYYSIIIDTLQQDLDRDGLETSLSKACQLFIDSSYLSQSSEFIFITIENCIVDLFGSDSFDSLTVSKAHDHVINKFRKLTTDAQNLMYKVLSSKINELLESLVFINYAPDAPPVNEAKQLNLAGQNLSWVHESVISIIDFLTIRFMCFTHLPQAIREEIHFKACEKVASGILNYILSDKVTKLNVFCLVSLDADCKRLISFADDCGITDLRKCFLELHEMIRAVLHPDLQALSDDIAFRKTAFPKVQPIRLAVLLEKVSL